MKFNMATGFPGGTGGKEPACQCRRYERHGFDPWVRKIPWRRAWQPTSQVALVVKNPPANTGDVRDTGSVPGLGRFPEGGNGSPLQYSCLGNPWTEEHYHYYYARKSQVKLKTCLGDYFPQEVCID